MALDAVVAIFFLLLVFAQLQRKPVFTLSAATQKPIEHGKYAVVAIVAVVVAAVAVGVGVAVVVAM